MKTITLPTASSFKVIFDFSFFFTYALGWLLTYMYQAEFKWNNNVTRVFGVYNICIGVDSFPAQPVASVTGTISFTFLGGVILAFNDRITLTAKHGYVMARRSLFLVGWVLTVAFMVTYSVPPNNYIMTVIHVGAFAVGSFGYCLLQVATILEYTKFADKPLSCKSRRDVVWLLAQSLQAIFLIATAFALFYLMATSDIKAEVATIDSAKVPAVVSGGRHMDKDEVHIDYKGDLLVFVAFVFPLVAALNQPEPFWPEPTEHRVFHGVDSDRKDVEE